MPQNDDIHSRFVGSHWGGSCLTSRLKTSNDYPTTSPDQGNADVLATTDTMTQSEGAKKIGAPARDRGSGLRQ